MLYRVIEVLLFPKFRLFIGMAGDSGSSVLNEENFCERFVELLRMESLRRGFLCFVTFDGNDIGETGNSVFRELSRSSFASSYDGKLESFSVLFQLAKLRLVAKMMSREFQLLLPSDHSWRLKNYFKLLNKQKEKTLILHMMPPDDMDEFPKWEQVVISQPEMKKAKLSGSYTPSSEGSVVNSQIMDLPWTTLDLAKAADLLGQNSDQVQFQDEEEMRRVFALLYDVFRYKYILSDALRETGFLQKYPKHQNNISLIWLLFYDLHKRRFLPRAHADVLLSCEAFEKSGLTNIEQDLWSSRIKLAASLARLRIKNNALRLNQLLPPHLRDERFVSFDETPVTGWINTFKKSKKEICDSIEKLGLRLQSKHETVLTKNDFRFDHLCPKLLLCHPMQRPELAQSPLIKDHTVVLQDRAFCIGPALMGKILMETPLRGTIAQTHVNTPRTTAYLANVLIENDRLEKLIAFGAGEKLLEYQTYLHELGITNCEIYAQRFADLHPEAAVLENLVAVLATPPNSYTGVTDPVDLICSRGGDMGMLKGLTQMEMSKDSLGYLDEQRDTLKYCMSLPQVQIILYETHSVAPEENFQMVNGVIELVNGMARESHEEEHRLLLEKEEAEEKLNKPAFIPGKPSSREQREKEAQEAKEQAPPREVEVPPCDLFEVVPLPDLCSHGPNCFSDEGCFLAKIQRKEIISLDAKYMIKIAEARGLFGADLGKKKVAAVRVPKKPERRRTSSAKIKVRRVKLEIDRLAAPTQSTIYRAKRESSPCTWSSPSCPRHQSHALETMNKGDADELSARSMDRRNSRTKRNQEESVKRLSKPINRGSTGTDTFSSEVKAKFWRYATAKSVEDLIRALKKKRKGKRIFKLEDYFFFKEEEEVVVQHQQQYQQQQPFQRRSLLSSTGTNDWKKHGGESTPEPSKNASKKSVFETYIPDIEIIKPYVNKDVLRITSYGAVSDQTSANSSQMTSYAGSGLNLNAQQKCGIIQQCMENASIIFKNIEEAVEENRKLAERRIRTLAEMKSDPFNQRRKFKNKNFSPLEALSKIEEISNIIGIKEPHNTDLVLPSKYFPGQVINSEEEKFFRILQLKLEKLQQSYAQPWTKAQEYNSARRLSMPRKPAKKMKKGR